MISTVPCQPQTFCDSVKKPSISSKQMFCFTNCGISSFCVLFGLLHLSHLNHVLSAI